MIDILSLPRRNTVSANQALTKLVGFKTGLPINSLPGWEQIPLNSKLPMLKCPGNQVIFSKNKIGQSFKSSKQEFDSSVRDKIPEYNPLHDSNLKTFYSNERNLKRLRENGEITQNNDVICNLKDFNEYRQDLHKSHLYYVLQEYRRREAEQHDRLLIENAETITKRDHMHLTARHQSQDEILMRKKRLDDERHKRFVRLQLITEEKFERLETLAEMQKAITEQRKMLNAVRMQQHDDVCKDLQRKHLIKLKKIFQFKKERFNRNMRLLRKQRILKTTEGQIQSWKKRLDERIANQQRLNDLLSEVSIERHKFIEVQLLRLQNEAYRNEIVNKLYLQHHKIMYQEKWNKIQDDIKKRSRQAMALRMPKKKRRPKRRPKPVKTSFCDEYQKIFEGLLDTELCYALNAAIALEGTASITFEPDDPIYKAAQYILNYILKRFDKDLSFDACALQILSERIIVFIKDAKKFVYVKSQQIIKFARDHPENWDNVPSVTTKSRNQSRISHVSFSSIASTIGFGAYEIHPFVDVRQVCDRRPTPAGSLASLVVSQIEDQVIHDKMQVGHLSRDEVVFVEHYLVKLKRELLVGMDKHVFAAIQCHFENKIVDLREDLLELDPLFLVDQIAKGILSYAVNPLNFQTCIKLAVAVLSSQVIAHLQKDFLRPNEAPRGFTYPTVCSPTDIDRITMCSP